jgi:hypothetical protein
MQASQQISDIAQPQHAPSVGHIQDAIAYLLPVVRSEFNRASWTEVYSLQWMKKLNLFMASGLHPAHISQAMPR